MKLFRLWEVLIYVIVPGDVRITILVKEHRPLPLNEGEQSDHHVGSLYHLYIEDNLSRMCLVRELNENMLKFPVFMKFRPGMPCLVVANQRRPHFKHMTVVIKISRRVLQGVYLYTSGQFFL